MALIDVLSFGVIILSLPEFIKPNLNSLLPCTLSITHGICSFPYIPSSHLELR